MVELKNVSFSYDDKQVLKGFSLNLSKGECVCLKGESGCGKTTVLRLLLGLEAPDSGSISVPKKNFRGFSGRPLDRTPFDQTQHTFS